LAKLPAIRLRRIADCRGEKMSERIFEEVAVIIKQKYTVRLLEYKESGNEFTEINVYSKETKDKYDEVSDHFAFGFTVKGRGEEEKERIEKMSEREFEEFIRHMTHFLEKKYNVVHKKEEKKEEKKEDKKEYEKSDASILDDCEAPVLENIEDIVE